MKYEEKTKYIIKFEDVEEINTFIEILNAALKEDLRSLQVFKRDIKSYLDKINL